MYFSVKYNQTGFLSSRHSPAKQQHKIGRLMSRNKENPEKEAMVRRIPQGARKESHYQNHDKVIAD